MKYAIDPDKVFLYLVNDKMQEEQLHMKSDIKEMGGERVVRLRCKLSIFFPRETSIEVNVFYLWHIIILLYGFAYIRTIQPCK